jgi:VWFA-related protein
MRNKLYPLSLALLLGALICAKATSAAPQSPAESKVKRQKFGSSLKRLKWDHKKNAAIETGKAEAKKEGDSRARPGEEAVRLEALYVMFDVTVTNPSDSRFLTTLTRDDFIVVEDGRAQQITGFARGDDQSLPRSILLVIDYSGSQRAYLQASISAAKTLISQLAAGDEMAIATDDVELLVDFTQERAKLVAALDSLEKRALFVSRDKARRQAPERRGRDLQFTALYAALREMIRGDDRRTIIIFQTDGTEAVTFRDQPTASDYIWNMPRREYGLADIYAAAERSRATIYTVIPSERLVGVPAGELYERGSRLLARGVRARYEGERGQEKYARSLTEAQIKLFTDRLALSQAAAARVAELTGGWTAFLERPEQAIDIYARILSDINHRYVVGYYPANTSRDGQWRSVRIEVRGHSDYIVHGRRGYYAPAAQ